MSHLICHRRTNRLNNWIFIKSLVKKIKSNNVLFVSYFVEINTFAKIKLQNKDGNKSKLTINLLMYSILKNTESSLRKHGDKIDEKCNVLHSLRQHNLRYINLR